MAQAVDTLYGAFELKRAYQRNMLMGTGFAAALQPEKFFLKRHPI